MSERRTFTRAQRIDVLHASGGCCHYCGKIINPAREDFEVEHPVPIALGGADDMRSVRPIHLHCHKEKTRADRRQIAKAKRVKAKFEGSFRPAKHSLPGGKTGRLKKKLNGAVVDRSTGKTIREGFTK